MVASKAIGYSPETLSGDDQDYKVDEESRGIYRDARNDGEEILPHSNDLRHLQIHCHGLECGSRQLRG